MDLSTGIAKTVYVVSVALVCITFMSHGHPVMSGLTTTGFALVALDWG